MSEAAATGVVYTEFRRLRASTPILSLWAYQSRVRERGRRPVHATPDGRDEYWLDRGDPLLNTILPGTAVSLMVNLGDAWLSGRTTLATDPVPSVCVVGPFIHARELRLGDRVCALGAVLPAPFAQTVFGCSAGDLVERIVHLEDLWPRWRVTRLLQAIHPVNEAFDISGLRDEVLDAATAPPDDGVAFRASRLLTSRGGRVSIHDLASAHGVSHQTFTRRFGIATGLAPKQFARISRFQALVHALLVTDVQQWAVAAPRLGFYDQAHMINEFRRFAGQPPTTFFQSRGESVNLQRSDVRGRPCEWKRPLADAARHE